MKKQFSRSNVNENTLQVTDPLRSSFDLSHRNNLTLKLGRLTPVNLERLIGTDVIQGSLSPQFQLEVAGTPTIGKLRLDTHTFQVNFRRIHTGFRQFIEDVSNNFVLPNFCIPEVIGLYLSSICSPSTSPVSPTLSSIFGTLTGTQSDAQLSSALKTNFINGLEAHITNTSTEFGFMKDFLAIERDRIKSLVLPTGNTKTAYLLLKIIEPLFGPGSLLDMLGYPIYSSLNGWYQWAIDTQFDDLITFINAYGNDSSKGTIKYLFRLVGFEKDGGGDPSQDKFDLIDDERYSEMPIRACYAIYYDYFRDWHVEPRSKVLDPDNFGATTLFSSGAYPTPSSILSQILQLLVLRYRYFARDFLTTVQTDDIYRHVYAPVFGDTSDLSDPSSVNNGVYRPNSLPYGGGTSTASVGSLVNIMANFGSDDVPFLGDLFYSSNPTDSLNIYSQGFFSDLQTMRRAGMLEKWLARNYFFPDTYVGQLRARYGVVPEDVNVLISQYLGGTESFVEGNQTVAPVDTPQMAAGSRTVVSGVNGKDSFTYRASDHCYIISFVSLMPLVNYDIKNMHTKELRVMDIPAPEFAQDSRVAIRTRDMLRSFDYQNDILGYVPRYYHYRVHGDETHGRYLTDLRSYAWFRDWYNMTFITDTLNQGRYFDSRGFALTPYALRVHLVPEAFNDKTIWDDIAFGSCDIEFFANRPLPAAVDII